MKSEKVLIDQNASEAEKSVVNIIAAFIANAQPTKLMHPTQRPFHHPAVLAPPAAMRRVPLGDDRLDPESAQGLAVWLRIIAPIALHPLGAATRMTDLASHRGNRLDQRQELSHIVRIRTGEDDRERDAATIRDEMMLAAGFGFIRGIRACFYPPCTARTEALSTTARDQSIWSAACSFAKSRSWRAYQTPAACQSRSRRKQVMPEPQPISWGRYSQGMPVLSTNRIPVRA